jgi:selT/selW/selH-like putative selenoprotein
MGDDLKKQFGATINLVAGSGGIYDIEVDGRHIFSKQQRGRFPELDEIISLIKN